ncbi:hypothetical protein DRW41_10335 [Neobacillus piezotolerans]|uniref:Uncharacterized protein n=1 Tax=Neobacillus piezotolerans TaxID=2259171 RepID=A0A3D8GRH4_9BACI|nr:hypothetical protein [Neobacillus piezotolerans]RDU37074.1 hypothetical protein DRW41_10335 [Neobacillus piezotolerans]
MKQKYLALILIFVLLFTLAMPLPTSMAKGPTIGELQKKITALTKQVKDLTGKLSAKTKEAKDVSTKLATKTKEAKDLSAKLTAKTKETEKLKTEKSNLSKQLNNKDALIDSKDRIIDEKEAELEKLKGQLEEQEKANKLKTASIVYTNETLQPGTNIKWYKFNTNRTSIYMTLPAFEQYSYILDSTDLLVADISKYFNTEIKSKFEIYVWMDENVTGTTGSEYKNISDRVLIRGSKFFPVNHSNKIPFVNCLAHEIAHAVQDLGVSIIDRNGKPGVFWVTEGTGMYIQDHYIDYTKYNFPEDHIIIDTPDKAKYTKWINDRSFLVDKVDVSTMSKLPKDLELHSDYSIYASIIYFIENQYGHGKLLDFIEYHKTLTTPDSVSKAFGVTEEQLVQDWKKYFSL